MLLYLSKESRFYIKRFASVASCDVFDVPKAFFNFATDLLTDSELYVLMSSEEKKQENRRGTLDLDIEEVSEKVNERLGLHTAKGTKFKENINKHKFLRALIAVARFPNFEKIYAKYKIEKDIEGARALLKQHL